MQFYGKDHDEVLVKPCAALWRCSHPRWEVQAQAAERTRRIRQACQLQQTGGTSGSAAGERGVPSLYHQKIRTACATSRGVHKKVSLQKFKRKLPAAMVTHRPEENVANVVSFDEGTR